jgi:hypothetical protein
MGRAGRRYAEATFSPDVAADRFLEVFGDLVAQPRRTAAHNDYAPAPRLATANRVAS